jgi:C1A family cysteine protease
LSEDVENDITTKRPRRTLATRTYFTRVTRPTVSRTRRTYAPWTFASRLTTSKRTTIKKGSTATVFSWVQLGKVTPVKDQGYCGKIF